MCSLWFPFFTPTHGLETNKEPHEGVSQGLLIFGNAEFLHARVLPGDSALALSSPGVASPRQTHPGWVRVDVSLGGEPSARLFKPRLGDIPVSARKPIGLKSI